MTNIQNQSLRQKLKKISILLTDYISKLSNKDATSIHSVLAGEPLITDFIEIARRYMNEGKDNRKNVQKYFVKNGKLA